MWSRQAHKLVETLVTNQSETRTTDVPLRHFVQDVDWPVVDVQSIAWRAAKSLMSGRFPTNWG